MPKHQIRFREEVTRNDVVRGRRMENQDMGVMLKTCNSTFSFLVPEAQPLIGALGQLSDLISDIAMSNQVSFKFSCNNQ